MKCRPLVFVAYASLVLTGWAAGRWLWPAAPSVPQATAGHNALAGLSVPTSGPSLGVVQKTQPTPTVDGTAAGLELKAAGSEAAFRDRARQMALEPPPALMDFLAAVTDSETVRQALLEDAVLWAYCRNPEKGLALLSSLKDRTDVASLTKKALHFFPPKDLPLVKACFEELPMGALKTALLKELIPVLQRADGREAIRLASAFPMEPQVDSLSRQVLLGQIWSRAVSETQSSADQQALLEEFPEETRAFLQIETLRQKFTNFRNNNKAAALDMLPMMLEAEKQFPLLYPNDPFAGFASKAAELFTQWAETDPLRASQNLSRLPEEAATPDLYRQLAAQWTTGNVGQASQWVRQLEDSPLKQAAIAGLAGKLGKDYPVEAITWAGTLTDSAERLRTLNSILADADRTAPPDALRQAVEALNLAPEERAGLTPIPTTR